MLKPKRPKQANLSLINPQPERKQQADVISMPILCLCSVFSIQFIFVEFVTAS